MPFSTLHFREEPEYWREWFPADFITESFPGQFRNWFYSMLAMSTVLRREPPFETIFGYALVFGEDGRPMHKSWGNAIEFDEAAERMGVDVMRWMFAKARPEDNILFGWHAADEARRELLVLWNVYAFFVTYARLAGWTPAGAVRTGRRARRARPLDPVAGRRARRPSSRTASATSTRSGRRGPCRPSWTGSRRGTCGSRASGCAATTTPRDRDAAFATLHEALTAVDADARADPAVPHRRDVPEPRDRCRRGARQRPPDAVADRRAGRRIATSDSRRRWPSPRTPSTWRGRFAARPASARASRSRQAWLALPDRALDVGDELLAIIAAEVNVKTVHVIADDSDLVERRVKPLLPKIGKRLGRVDPGGDGRGARRRRRRSAPTGR